MILLGTSHSRPFPSKWLISTTGSSWEIIHIEKKWFPPWSWSCDITWHDGLIFFLSLITHFFPIYFRHFLYKVFFIVVIIILIGDHLFTLSNGKSTFFYYYYHICLPWLIQSSFNCHDSSKAASPAMGMWTKFWQTRHSLCTWQTKVSYSWTDLNSLIQNTWASVQ